VLIDDPETARRLARAICEDIRLYHGAQVSAAAPADRTRVLAEPVTEGFVLFSNRVAPSQMDRYEEAVIALHEALGAPFHGIALPAPAEPESPRFDAAPAAHPPVPRPGRERDEPTSTGGAPAIVIAALAVILALAGGVVAFMLVR
jgi:hypothetical protein